MQKGKIWVFITIVILVCILLASSLSQWFSSPNKMPFASQNSKELGVKALYLLFEKRGKQAKIWNSPYDQLPTTQSDTLLMIEPQADPPTEIERRQLLNWVKQGNQIILWSNPDMRWAEAFQFEVRSCVTDDSVRHAYTSSKDPWLQRVYMVEWPSQQCAVLDEDDKPLLVDSDQNTLIVTRQVGKGRIVYIPETSIVTNQEIDQYDHVAIPLAFVEGKSGTIWFDESIHPWPPQLVAPPKSEQNGVSQESSDELNDPEPLLPAFFQLLRIDVWFVLLQILIFVLFLLYARGRRFAAPRFESVQEKRNSLEYVQAMTRWYQRSHLRKEVLVTLYHQLKTDLTERLQLPAMAEDMILYEEIERRWGASYRESYERLTVVISEMVSSKRKVNKSSFVEWSSFMIQMRKEINQWRAIPQTELEFKQ